MARPKRYNADYFTHDADFRNDRRIKAIRQKFGIAGYGIINMLLEVLTNSDHIQINTDELELELLSGDFDVSVTDIHSMIQFAEKVTFFTRNEAGFLICPDLNKALQPVFDKRNNSKTEQERKHLGVSVTETNRNVVSVTESTQSKVKKSKVNESKVKEIEIEKYLSDDDLFENSKKELIEPFASGVNAIWFSNQKNNFPLIDIQKTLQEWAAQKALTQFEDLSHKRNSLLKHLKQAQDEAERIKKHGQNKHIPTQSNKPILSPLEKTLQLQQKYQS